MAQTLPPDLLRNAGECKNDTKCRSEVVRPRLCSPGVIDLAVPTMLRLVKMSLDPLDPRYALARQHLKNHGSENVLVAERGEVLMLEELFFRDRKNVNVQKRRTPCGYLSVVGR